MQGQYSLPTASNAPMELDAIIAALEYCRTPQFPHQAVQAAVRQKDAITPLLLKALEDTKTNLEAIHQQQDYFLHIYAMFLLAQFRETRAYPLLVDLYATPGDIVYDITGDTLTEDLGRILASVSGGDISLIKQLIEGPDVFESVCSAGLTALVTLVVECEISRESVLDYFQTLLLDIEEEDSFLGSLLAVNSLELFPNEAIIPTLRNAYEKNIVDPLWSDLDELEMTLEEGPEQALQQLQRNHGYKFVVDVEAEMSWWACFQDNVRKPTQRQKSKRMAPMGASTTFGFAEPKKGAAKRKKKRKAQKQSRKQNRSKKKR